MSIHRYSLPFSSANDLLSEKKHGSIGSKLKATRAFVLDSRGYKMEYSQQTNFDAILETARKPATSNTNGFRFSRRIEIRRLDWARILGSHENTFLLQQVLAIPRRGDFYSRKYRSRVGVTLARPPAGLPRSLNPLLCQLAFGHSTSF